MAGEVVENLGFDGNIFQRKVRFFKVLTAWRDGVHRPEDQLRSEDVDRFELIKKDRLWIASEPMLQGGCVDLAEVDVELQVAVFEFFQVGGTSDGARFDGGSGEEHWTSGTVVGSFARVLFDASAKFTEGHHGDAICLLLVLNVIQKRLHGIA